MSATSKTLLGILVFAILAGAAAGIWVWIDKPEDEVTNTNTAEVTSETMDDTAVDEEEEEEPKEPVEIYEYILAQDLPNWDTENQTFPSLIDEGSVKQMNMTMTPKKTSSEYTSMIRVPKNGSGCIKERMVQVTSHSVDSATITFLPFSLSVLYEMRMEQKS